MGTCEHCSGRATEYIHRTGGGTYVRCQGCRGEVQFRAAGALPSERFIDMQKEYYGDSTVYLLPFMDVLGIQAARYRLATLRRYMDRGHILEVGPGVGHFLSLASRRGYSCEAVEHSEVLARTIVTRHSIPVHIGDFEQVPLPEQRFDGYLSFHVIEHVPDPVQHLRAALRAVRGGGYALIATPNSTGLEHRIMGRASPNYTPAHLRLFSPESLSLTCEQSGWEVVGKYTNARTEDWIRVLTAILRRLGRSRNESRSTIQDGTSIVRRVPKPFATLALHMFSTLSWVPRKAQRRLGLGNELILVAQKPLSIGDG